MEQATLNVKGMSCGHCVSAVEGNVGEMKGVSDVNVDLDYGTVEVSYDKSNVTHEDIVDTIEDQGYDVG
ncbi:copper chaperone CopZ [Salicibibacter kimchii]|uniref:Copper chaperone CopZ n=1 Tax=Salicibibacter kimchii TaxID=2099786 RepID=A0A345BX60_9BACI|nr:copper chaperone CopZ [Salicibibacter kimchii]AXF55541.1 copper resistance protein CopZ [Salicibibacter kimchii]